MPRGAVARKIGVNRMAVLQITLNQLRERQRPAVVLRHTELPTCPEIGQIVHIGVEAVKILSTRGKRAPAAILARKMQGLKYEYDEEGQA